MIRAATQSHLFRTFCHKSKLSFYQPSNTIDLATNICVSKVSRYLSTSTQNGDEKKLPLSAEIVVAGAGAVGSSVAYHLAKLGWKDVLVLEQGLLGCGTSWHAAGLIGCFRENKIATSMALYAAELYSEIENETGLGTGFKRCGSVNIATSKDKATQIRRMATNSRKWNVEVEELTANDALKLYPLLKNSDIEMAVWLPNDGVATSSDVCQSLMRGATLKGVRFLQGVGVKHVSTSGRRVIGVETDQGFVHCNVFINCSGLWARELGLRTNPPVNLPLHSCEHFYIVTKPMEGVHNMLPVLRDGNSRIYIREWSGGLMAGGFEPVAKPCFHQMIPDQFVFQLLEEDWDQFDILMQGILNRIPSTNNAEIRQFLNGPESFTPDGRFLFGEVPEVKNYYVVAGMNSTGIVSAAGIGKMLSELVTFDSCLWDYSAIDIKRFGSGQNNKLYLRDRVKEVLGFHYSISYPKNDMKSARHMKCSPLQDILDKAGASWGDVCGWEKADWFATNETEKEHLPTFGKPAWLSDVEREYKACKEGVAIADLSWLSKFMITGSDDINLAHVLQRIFARDIHMNIGMSINTAMLNPAGGYEGLVNLIKLDKAKYMVTVAPAHHTRVLSWITQHLPEDENIQINDSTGGYSALAILGPLAERLLSQLSQTPLNLDQFPLGHCKIVDLGYASDVYLLRGMFDDHNHWQLFMPVEYTIGIYRMLHLSKTELGITNVGCFALDTLRVEKGIPEFGAELGQLTKPVEMGEKSGVDFKKESNYIGQDAIRKQLDEKSSNSLVLLKLHDVNDDSWAWGGEPIQIDHKMVGHLASVAYSFKDNSLVGLTVLNLNEIEKAQSIVVEVAGVEYPATVLKCVK